MLKRLVWPLTQIPLSGHTSTWPRSFQTNKLDFGRIVFVISLAKLMGFVW